MNPRPLYRWKSFWLGVLVIGFLGWAWWLSYGYRSYASRGELVVFHEHGYVCGGRWLDMGDSYEHLPLTPGTHVFQFAQPPLFARGEGWVPSVSVPASNRKTTYSDYVKSTSKAWFTDWWILFIPHWLLIAVFAVAWAAMLAWRWRRQATLTKSHE